MLSGGNEKLSEDCRVIVREMIEQKVTPPAIANTFLRLIKERTGITDPYRAMKDDEFRKARTALETVKTIFPKTLEGCIKISALGNSSDFFINTDYNDTEFHFFADMDKIEEEIYNKRKYVLILGDNVGDFVFDMPLIGFFGRLRKLVYYVVREYPVQNDLSMIDVERFGLREFFSGFLSTGTDEVGLLKKDIQGRIKELWTGDAVVIAKGMGNYETMTEFAGERSVIHIMKIKCPAVAEAVGKDVGTYIAQHRW